MRSLGVYRTESENSIACARDHMRRLIRSLPLSIAIALALAPPATRAQAPMIGGVSVNYEMQVPAPLPERLVPPAVQAMDAERAAVDTTFVRRRSAWRYPLIGVGAGTLVGAGFGTCIVVSADEYMGPIPHFFTVPAGAVLGLVIGGAMNLVDPR